MLYTSALLMRTTFVDGMIKLPTIFFDTSILHCFITSPFLADSAMHDFTVVIADLDLNHIQSLSRRIRQH
jgi:hypothetical protein